MASRKLFDGVKIAGFAWVIQGPYSIKFLADYGADVVRIESTTHPDVTRLTAPYKDGIIDVNHSAVFNNLNTSKYSITIDLNHPKGIDLAKRLCLWSDVVVENFAIGTMERWKIGYEDLKREKADIIMVSLSLFGQTGPWRRRDGFGALVQGAAGSYDVTGWPDGEPSCPAMTYTDPLAGWAATIAILAALDYRRRTGSGLHMDISQLEVATNAVYPGILDYMVNHKEYIRKGNRSSFASPCGAFPCRGSDRWCVINITTDEEWGNLIKVMGNPGWMRESRFSTFLDRKENEDELEKLLAEWTSNHTPEEVMNQLQEANVEAGIVENNEDYTDKDPQLKHRQYFQELEYPVIGRFQHHGAPSRFSKTPTAMRRTPFLGEHVDYVCTQLLGMSDEEFTKILASGAIR